MQLTGQKRALAKGSFLLQADVEAHGRREVFDGVCAVHHTVSS
jgi:hypothetical protein